VLILNGWDAVMSLSPKKIEILEAMLLYDKPTRVTQIAKDLGNEFPPVMMHLVGLTRMGFTTTPEKAYYAITQKGKEALGLPEVNRENAKSILAYVSNDKMFHFYAEIGKPLSYRAHSLQDFCNVLLKVELESIDFHVKRGDFEAWFKCLGDTELAKKAALLKEKKLAGEELRAKLHEIVETRYIQLAKVLEHTAPT
jgi:hypothetical protein